MVAGVSLLMQSDGSTFPTASNYTYKLTLDQQNATRVLSLCPSELAGQEWKASTGTCFVPTLEHHAAGGPLGTEMFPRWLAALMMGFC